VSRVAPVEADMISPLSSREPSQPPAGPQRWMATVAYFDKRGRRRSSDHCEVTAHNWAGAIAAASVLLGAEPGAIACTRIGSADGR
jgi:hypothetical protein